MCEPDPVTVLEPRWIDLGGLRLRYLDVGDGPPLLVIPGHTSRIEGFAELVPHLVDHHRVLILDCPGSGESAKPVRRYDLRFYEDTLVGFLDALGVEGATPVGGSLGGNLVLRLGHRFPDRFDRIILWAPGSAWEAKPAVARVTEAIAASRLAGRALFWPTVKVQSRFWYHPDFAGRERELRETFAYYRRVMGPGFVAMYWGMAADQLRHSLFPLAPEVAQPTLLMWGDQDHGAGMGDGVARLHELLPDSRLHVFEGRRHSLEAECPAELGARILAGHAELGA